ncbi:CHAT domain-containing protein [Actinomadura chibensis]|uniref:CHAT domain-containing protein n=1 Tax=Actinomadura chibensis TaxID=392828 RepID=A0A5D0NM35_9ACTN|nr:CHAT domain-containing protein [Actinomadura chibensis]TYB45522.1 CHAT domain-containing protein [Actinomadura chibensis]
MTTILAEYLVTDDATHVFLVRPDGDEPRTETLALTRDELRAHVARFRAATRGHETPAADEPLAALVAPVAEACEPGDVVWFVPHDTLHYVPLGALPVDGAPLVERNAVCYTPSASVMRYCQAKRSPDARRVVVYADSRPDRPLPHARQQAGDLGRRFGADAVLRFGRAAALAALPADAGTGTSRILHFGCHGTFTPQAPLDSAIVLADGELTAERILGSSLRADLVTLSACESGVNAHRPGDELVGLTRALIYAGAASVLVSLWSVDEVSTSLLMDDFYRELAAGTSKAESLRRAQNTLRAMPATTVIKRCEESLGAGDLLDEDVADARFRCGDFGAARDGYARLLARADPGDARTTRWRTAEARCRRAAEAATEPPDYGRAIYSDPYHWAAFVLVGDWR